MYSNIGLIDFKRPISAYDPDPVEARAWIGESQDVRLKLSRELLRLKHLGFRLKILKKHSLLAIDPVLCLHRVGFNYVRYVLYEEFFSDCIFLKKGDEG